MIITPYVPIRIRITEVSINTGVRSVQLTCDVLWNRGKGLSLAFVIYKDEIKQEHSVYCTHREIIEINAYILNLLTTLVYNN